MRNQWVVRLSLPLLLGSGAFSANASEDLESLVRAQGELIQELRYRLEEMQSKQTQSEDRVLALEDKLAMPSVGSTGEVEIDADYIDRRIEAFQTSDNSRLFLSGYGNVLYGDVMDDGDLENPPSTFRVQFNPVFHFRLTERLHFNAELEIELDDGGETELEMEYARIDYLVNDWLSLSAGKFFTPFNRFGADIHPPWINKLASRPVIYDKNRGVIPVMTDVGVMASGGFPLWSEESKLNYAL